MFDVLILLTGFDSFLSDLLKLLSLDSDDDDDEEEDEEEEKEEDEDDESFCFTCLKSDLPLLLSLLHVLKSLNL